MYICARGLTAAEVRGWTADVVNGRATKTVRWTRQYRLPESPRTASCTSRVCCVAERFVMRLAANIGYGVINFPGSLLSSIDLV